MAVFARDGDRIFDGLVAHDRYGQHRHAVGFEKPIELGDGAPVVGDVFEDMGREDEVEAFVRDGHIAHVAPDIDIPIR